MRVKGRFVKGGAAATEVSQDKAEEILRKNGFGVGGELSSIHEEEQATTFPATGGAQLNHGGETVVYKRVRRYSIA